MNIRRPAVQHLLLMLALLGLILAAEQMLAYWASYHAFRTRQRVHRIRPVTLGATDERITGEHDRRRILAAASMEGWWAWALTCSALAALLYLCVRFIVVMLTS